MRPRVCGKMAARRGAAKISSQREQKIKQESSEQSSESEDSSSESSASSSENCPESDENSRLKKSSDRGSKSQEKQKLQTEEHRKKRRRKEKSSSDEESSPGGKTSKQDLKTNRGKPLVTKNLDDRSKESRVVGKQIDKGRKYHERDRDNRMGHMNEQMESKYNETDSQKLRKKDHERKERIMGDTHHSRDEVYGHKYDKKDFSDSKTHDDGQVKDRHSDRKRDRRSRSKDNRRYDENRRRRNRDEIREDRGRSNTDEGRSRTSERDNQQHRNRDRHKQDRDYETQKKHGRRDEREWDREKNDNGGVNFERSKLINEGSREMTENMESGAAKGESNQPKEEPNYELSGKLTEFTNTFKGVVIKYNEPPEARKPKTKWRLYPFKGEKELPVLHLHRQSAYLLGRNRMIADIPVDHPSCSSQHAVVQFRLVDHEKPDGAKGKRVKPYVIDLESSNGTYVNNNKIDSRRYFELKERDVLKFGYSSREYVILHDKSKDDDSSDDDDEAPNESK